MALLLALILSGALSKAAATTQDQSSHYSCELFNTLPQHIVYGEDEDWTYLADTTSTSADGNVIATGEPNTKMKRGRGVLMTRRDKEYPWTTTVIEGEVENSRFGYDVSVAGNGGLLAVGAVWDGGMPPFYNSGGVYLYEVPMSKNTNVPFQKLIGDRLHIRNGDHFGHRVALDHDGNTVVVTAPHHGGINGNMRDTGALEVYKRTNDIEQFVSVAIIYGDHATDRFGMGGLDLSADGTIFAVSGPHARQSEATPDQGVVKVYEISADAVTCLQEFWGPVKGIMLGHHHGVALSETGHRLAFSYLGHGNSRGEVKFYERHHTTGYYALIGRPIEGTNTGDYLGHSINFALDGSRAVIGAKKGETADSEYKNTGTVEIFDFNFTTSTYESTSDILAGNFPGDNFGTAVSMSEDGSTLLVGASGYDHHNHVTNGKLSIYQTSCTDLRISPAIPISNSTHVSKILANEYSDYLTAYQCNPGEPLTFLSGSHEKFAKETVLTICFRSSSAKIADIETIMNLLVEEDIENGEKIKYVDENNFNHENVLITCALYGKEKTKVCIAELQLPEELVGGRRIVDLKVSGDASLIFNDAIARVSRNIDMLSSVEHDIALNSRRNEDNEGRCGFEITVSLMEYSSGTSPVFFGYVFFAALILALM